MPEPSECRGNRDQPVQPPDLSIVVPVYNEEQGLPSLLNRLGAMRRSLPGLSLEVVFVDDHSTDSSAGQLAKVCSENPEYRFIRLSSNRGSHVAIFAGLERCRGRCAVFLAADLQDPPELVPKMLNLWQQGFHTVWAVRDERRGISWLEKKLARTFYGLFNRLAQVSLPPQGSDFALIDHAVLDAVCQSAAASPFLMGEIAQAGFRQTTVGYVKEERRFGRTKWNLRKRLRLFADAFVAFSYSPLRAMSYLGITASILGFLYASVIIILRLFVGAPIEGWASLMVVVLVLGGFQMVMLGVLGEYLWRTLEEARRRPSYYIEASVGMDDQPPGQASFKPRDVRVAGCRAAPGGGAMQGSGADQVGASSRSL